jgi:mannitol-specific phosphotransferase system IIBC component
LLLQATGNEVQVILLNNIALFLLLDNEGVDLQCLLVIFQLIIWICKFWNILLDEIVQMLMNRERQPLAIAVVESKKIGEDVLLLPIRKILHQRILIHVAVLEQHYMFVILRLDD